MKAVVICQVIPFKRPADRPHIVFFEAEGLEIGKTPVSLAQCGLYLNRTAVSCDTIILAAGRLERMAVAHPDLGLLREFLEKNLVDRDRFGTAAEIRKNCGLEGSVPGIARLFGQQALHVRQGLSGFRLPIEYSRVFVASSTATGR